MSLWLLWALTGGALSTAVMMKIWLPDPPPDITGRFLGVLVAGLVGGVLGGYLTQGAAAGSNLPPIVGAAAGGLVLSGAAALLGGMGRRIVGK